MPLHQFNLTAIPRQGILKELGFIPDKLPFILTELEPQNGEYSIKQLIKNKNEWSKKSWYVIDNQPIEIIHQIDKYVKRANYGTDLFVCWKTYTDEIDNDASLQIDEKTGKIVALIFRSDLRENELKFLKNIIDLAKLYDWLLVDFEGNIAEPNKEAVKQLIILSHAYKFMENIENYLQYLA